MFVLHVVGFRFLSAYRSRVYGAGALHMRAPLVECFQGFVSCIASGRSGRPPTMISLFYVLPYIIVLADRVHPPLVQVRDNVVSCEADAPTDLEEGDVALLLQPSNARCRNLQEFRYFRDRQQL